MPINVAKELATLQQLSVGDLRERYSQLFQETTQARNRPWLIKRIIWRMQSIEQGGLSERALQRAKELAATSDLRVTAPTRQRTTDGATTRTIECSITPSRTPLPGTLLTRRYKGQLIQVRVLAEGFEYLGERYRSLSAIAKQITGSHCSGNRFFQLTSAKHWVTKKGEPRGGHPFTKNSLYALLTNVTYLGQLKYKDEVHAGEHTAIVTEDQFDRVRKTLLCNGHSGGRAVRNKHGALLKGLLRCGSCQCAMSHSYSCKGIKRYRYYVCGTALQKGWDQCPAPSVPAGEIERFVVDQIQQIGTDPKLITETIRQVRLQSEDGIQRLTEERTSLQQQLKSHHADLQATASLPSTPQRVSQFADLQEQLCTTERRLTEIDSVLSALRANQIDESDVTRLLADFPQTWAALAPRDQARVLELLIERIDYRGKEGQISLTFRASGIQTLTQETAV